MDLEVIEVNEQTVAERLGQPEGTFKTEGEQTLVVKEGTQSTENGGGNAEQNGQSNSSSATPIDLGKIGISYFEEMGLTNESIKPDAGVDPATYIKTKLQEKAIDSLPPFTKFVLQHEKTAGFKPEDFVAQFAANPVANLKGDALISEFLYDTYGKFDETNNPDGLRDTDVTDHLGKMNRIEKLNLEKQAAEHFKANVPKKMQEFAAAREAESLVQFSAAVDHMTQFAQRAVDQSKAIKTIAGVDIPQTEIAEFNKVFPAMVTPVKETGLAPMLELIYGLDEKGMYELAYFLSKKSQNADYFKELVSERVNTAKSGVKKKLGLTPREVNQGQNTGLKEIDPFLLTQPDRNQ